MIRAQGGDPDAALPVARESHVVAAPASGILTRLGGMLFVLTRSMPQLGWRLVADALAHIQIQCIAHGLAADGLARECTVSLFAALSNELPDEQRQLIMAYSAEAVRTWQEARRSGGASVH